MVVCAVRANSELCEAVLSDIVVFTSQVMEFVFFCDHVYAVGYDFCF